MVRASLVLAAATLLGGCVLFVSRSRTVDGGRACLVTEGTTLGWEWDTGTTGALVLDDGDVATVEILVSTCASGSTQWRLACDAELDGSTLTITSVARSRTPAAVTADCNLVSMTCATPPLPEGALTVIYGDDVVEIEVPYDGEPVCLQGA